MTKALISFVIAVFVLGGATLGQSLGDVARASRAAHRGSANRVYTNDDLATPIRDEKSEGVKEATDGDATEAEASDAKPEKPAKSAKTSLEAKAEKGPLGDADKKKLTSELQSKFDEQKRSVDLLQRELDVLQREYQIQTTVYYSDAGSRLRDPKDWVETRQRYENGIDEKKKALADAKTMLDDIQDEARKADISVKASQ